VADLEAKEMNRQLLLEEKRKKIRERLENHVSCSEVALQP